MWCLMLEASKVKLSRTSQAIFHLENKKAKWMIQEAYYECKTNCVIFNGNKKNICSFYLSLKMYGCICCIAFS